MYTSNVESTSLNSSTLQLRQKNKNKLPLEDQLYCQGHPRELAGTLANGG